MQNSVVNMVRNMRRRARPASMVSLVKLEQRGKRENAIMTMLILSLLIQVTTLILMMKDKGHVTERSIPRIGKDFPSADVKNNIIGTRSISDEAGINTSNKNEEYFEYSKNRTRIIPRIDKDFPSADIIKSILMEEQHMLANHNHKATVDDLAKVYELVYAFIAAFQRHDIPIFVGYGSHLGARRHHGIIPFGEKDVDFEVFSVDEGQVRSIISEVLQLKESWSSIAIKKNSFGFQLNEETMSDRGLKYFVDFWLFESNASRDNQIICKGTKLSGKNKQGKTGCWLSYHNRGIQNERSTFLPEFKREDYFPPVYQVFGSHRVPIPRTSKELETLQYNMAEEHWNTTCGSHRVWLGNRWGQVPKEGRECSRLYDKYPFVFKTEDGTEALRQSDITIHRSELET